MDMYVCVYVLPLTTDVNLHNLWKQEDLNVCVCAQSQHILSFACTRTMHIFSQWTYKWVQGYRIINKTGKFHE